ncbi:MAG: orotidine 5'-phosphate decarboxylase [Chloroflexi bacterium]|nr:orotidine 5'-phosphate decarboxylase [Chloroflexota bacterium]
MLKLQLALDGELSAALDILAETRPHIDIAEVGTPLIYREGMRAVRKIRALYPALTLLADLKIMDAGDLEADIAFAAGADFVTVLGLANDATIAGAAQAARTHGKRVMADMMQVADPLMRGRRLLALGCDALCLHRAQDLQASQAAPYALLAELHRQLPEAQLAIAGGLTLDALPQILPCLPQIIIVGGAITRTSDPATMARRFAERIRNHEHSRVD